MEDTYIYGVRVLVKDPKKAASWLCEALFFSMEKDGEEPVVRSGDFRIVLTSKGESGNKEAAFGFTHIALETENMEAAIAYAKELGFVLELAENGGAKHSGKVYGTGMDYFNIRTDFGLTVEVSRKLHVKCAGKGKLIEGLDHIGLQTADLEESLRFYEKLGFEREFAPVVNHADGREIRCCMVSSGGTVVEIYEICGEKREKSGASIDAVLLCKYDAECPSCYISGPDGENVEFLLAE